MFGGVSGSLIGGIYMQKSGKYFWLTAIMYLNMFLGSIAILLVSGLVVQSLPGVSAGESYLILIDPLPPSPKFPPCFTHHLPSGHTHE